MLHASSQSVKAPAGRAASLLGTFSGTDTVDCSGCGEQSELITVGFGLDLGMCCDLFLEFRISHVIFTCEIRKYFQNAVSSFPALHTAA